MLKLILIRHFATAGNRQKKYIGITDEPLCEMGKQQLQHIHYPQVEAVFASPMLRCIQTAQLIYQDQEPFIYEGLRECDFGDFENKNYQQLSSNPAYQEWIDSHGTIPFPNGECPHHFKARNIKAFDELIAVCRKNDYQTIAMVVHGGTIMSILDRYSHPHEDYYHWQVDNGNGYYAEMQEDDRRLTNLCTIHSLR